MRRGGCLECDTVLMSCASDYLQVQCISRSIINDVPQLRECCALFVTYPKKTTTTVQHVTKVNHTTCGVNIQHITELMDTEVYL